MRKHKKKKRFLRFKAFNCIEIAIEIRNKSTLVLGYIIIFLDIKIDHVCHTQSTSNHKLSCYNTPLYLTLVLLILNQWVCVPDIWTIRLSIVTSVAGHLPDLAFTHDHRALGPKLLLRLLYLCSPNSITGLPHLELVNIALIPKMKNGSLNKSIYCIQIHI